MTDFGGTTYCPERDAARLKTQLGAVYRLMRDQRYRTLAEVSAQTHTPEASISARLRDLRKSQFGAYQVDRRIRHGHVALYEYAVFPPLPDTQGVLFVREAVK